MGQDQWTLLPTASQNHRTGGKEKATG